MVSGIGEQLHRLVDPAWQTLRGHVNHRAREPPKALLNEQHIVRMRHDSRDNNELVELSVLRYKH
jgi:hypothetical protein